MRTRVSIRYLLLAANAFVLLIPVFAVVFFHLWEGHLVRITEQQLIAEAAIVAEAWKDRVMDDDAARLERDRLDDADDAAPAHRALRPVDAVLELNYVLEPPAPPPARFVEPGDGPEWRAGRDIRSLLERAQRVNLSAVHVLDGRGCTVASTGDDLGACLDELPEVRAALAGQYAATARERLSEGDAPPLSGISRRGGVRVFSALPIRDADRVLGVALLSRTSASPLEVFWRLRYTVLAAALLCLAVTVVVSLFLSLVISQPLAHLTRSAEAIVRGEAPRPFASGRIAPAEVAALAEALERMTQQLTDRAEYISHFATNVSHELKTPIAAIRGAVELLREDWESMSAAQRRRFLDNVAGDAERMERLATRLLQLARIQSSPETAEPLPVEPFFEALLGRYDGSVRLHLSGPPAEIVINPDHLETAVRNLVDNAVRHGSGRPVEVTVRAAGDRLAVEVRDYGAGISDGNRGRVFERFFTTERDLGGTGLGLSIVRAVAETRGGEVTFATGPGGTTFTLLV